jgi:aryl-alcohol dehydrogenase-like predicted oxidoreductase
MRRRPLGRTGIAVSECTFGTLPLDQGADAAAVREALELALDNGVNAIELGGGGRAEHLLGEMVPKLGNVHELHILSRLSACGPFDIPTPQVPAFDVYPGKLIREKTERLLKVLKVERLGCQMIHAWCPEWLGEGDWLEELQRLKQEGKIAAIGVSLFDHDCDAGLQIAASGTVDCIEIMYNIFDPGPAQTLLPICAKQGVGVIGRSPFYFGVLAGRLDDPAPFPAGDWRGEFFYPGHRAECRERARALSSLAEREGEDVAGLALRFAASHPTISTIAAGMSSAQQVRRNLDALDRGALTAGTLAVLRDHRWLC